MAWGVKRPGMNPLPPSDDVPSEADEPAAPPSSAKSSGEADKLFERISMLNYKPNGYAVQRVLHGQ